MSATALCVGAAASAVSPADMVNPLMGTQSSYELSTGNTYPAVALPWGMNFWTPQTGKTGDGWAYTYDAHRIRGFKQTHQPSPWINDYGQFALMATVGRPVFDDEARASWFSHKSEIARPYYYSTYLADYDVTVELTPTERAAMFRFTFPDTDSANVVIDALDRGSMVQVDLEHHTVSGYTTRNSGGVAPNFRNWFVIEFDTSFDRYMTVADSVMQPRVAASECGHAGAVVTFRTARGSRVHARVASSFISLEQARRNLAELGAMSFDSVRDRACERWNHELGKIKVEGGSERQTSTFYSCLYRSLLFPRKFYEYGADGRPYHYSPHTGEVCPGVLYTDTGVWDTFRALFPLLNLVYPEASAEMQESFLNHYRESGFVPEWSSPGHRDCMVGNNSASVLADAYLSGICVADTATLWRAATSGVNAVHPTVKSSGRLGFDYYNRLGYVPCDVGIDESVARTLEYAYDDWCLYRLGMALNRPASELEPFRLRAGNYRRLFDADSRLMRGRMADGSWQSPFSPLKWGGDFTEGNSWHYTWSVFHGADDLAQLMGGREAMAEMLDSVFNVPPLYDDSYYGFPIHEIREMTVMNMGNYAHGNQPIQHMLYLYNTVGQPWKAEPKLYEVMNRLYSPTPDGYCGDEDNGQTSAWYVFSALGFYPLCPASGQYAIGTPLFTKVIISMGNGRLAVITADSQQPYVSSVSINGHPYGKLHLTLDQLRRGAKVHFTKSPTPNTKRSGER